ncbi:unnamed protein product [Vicia faba]|uniref:Uncharacterized protein n=1 Tax=Vicia faba TaxID=3906 RepID=A0AAV1A2P6_VICFA|nr:unnamed protein product [Vicia faba]
MARITTRVQGKSKKTKKKKGPDSTADGKKTRLTDEIMGVEPIDFESISIEEEILTHDEDSEAHIEAFLTATWHCSQRIKKCETLNPPILHPISQNLDEKFKEQIDLSERKKSSTSNKVKIVLEDIEDEIAYWKSSIVCYMLGANPPLQVLEGFIRRIWKGK